MIELSLIDTADIRQLSELERLCFSCPWSEESFRECIENERFYFLGAYEDGELIGYGGILTVLDEGDVVNIAVREDRRGQGIAKMLLSALKDEAERRGVGYLHLEVRESNSPARHLYQGFGFIPDGIRKNYYTKPIEHAILMTLRISPK